MNPPPEEELRAQIRRQSERLDARERRLDRLEAVGASPAQEPPPPAAPPPRPRGSSFETRLGLAWINRAGVVTLVLGAGLLAIAGASGYTRRGSPARESGCCSSRCMQPSGCMACCRRPPHSR